jgi:predicted nucleic acid-binding protein
VENKVILLDTGILIDFFRKKDKSKSVLFQLSQNSINFQVSAITEYEILLGATDSQMGFWKSFFDRVKVLSFDEESAIIAAQIYKQLKSQNKLIAIADILIASTALKNHAPLATLNKKHFSRINMLDLLELSF